MNNSLEINKMNSGHEINRMNNGLPLKKKIVHDDTFIRVISLPLF